MSILSPVALIERPSLVDKKYLKRIITTITIIISKINLFPLNIVLFLSIEILELKPITIRLIVYKAVLVIIPARIEGTRLILTIQEEEIPQDSVTETETPCSLAADVEGTIVKIITKAGTPQVLPGDICKKGELLVLGRLEILNDSQEIIRYEYVHADADIYVEHELPYYREFSLSHEEEFLSGDTEHHSYIRLGNFYLDTGKTQKSGWRRTAWEKQVRLTENFYLPIWLGNVTFEKIQKVTSVYSKEEAKSLAVKQLQQYEEKLIEQGMEISANHVKIETDYDSCTARGTLTVIEKTGIPVAVERKEDEET